MLNAEKKSITQALFVVSYERDSTIRTKQFDIEKVLAPLLQGPSISTNLPDDFNPQAPRFTIKQGQVSVNFSQIAAQLTIDIDNVKGQPIEVIKNSITKRINLFQNCVDKIIPLDQQREHGLVIILRYPVDSTKFPDEAVLQYIQSKFFRTSPLGSPASAEFNLGYKTDDNFFITLSVNDYKLIDTTSAANEQWINLLTLPVKESGIQLKIDVNSKPMVAMSNKPADITGAILKKTFDFVLTDADLFMGIQK
ncbi:MAG: hypothetical protein WAW61_13570 [Methylococcaceae bacterium]